MATAANGLVLKATLGLVQLTVVMAVALFVPAGSTFVEGWIFLGIFAGSSLTITLYLMKSDPALLERRTQAGPLAEKERSQKVIQGLASVAFLATLVMPGLDHRFGWSHPRPAVVVLGDVLVALGFVLIFFVFRANTFTSAVIEVAADQEVIDTGPYAIVRHPMYSAALVMFIGVPLALGSFASLVTYVPFALVIEWRVRDEERFLATRLKGYAAYCEKTRYRLIPGVW